MIETVLGLFQSAMYWALTACWLGLGLVLVAAASAWIYDQLVPPPGSRGYEGRKRR